MSDDGYMYIYKTQLIRVVDGDTVILDIDLGFEVRSRRVIRMIGIDAPESRGSSDLEKQAAAIAKEKLIEMLDGKQILLCSHKEKTDKYARYLGNLYVDSENINNMMVQKGLAKEYKDEKTIWDESELNNIISLGG